MFGLCFCLESEVQIQRASAGRGGPPGREYARAGTGRRGRVSGQQRGVFAAPVARKFPVCLRHLIQGVLDYSADIIAGSLSGKIAYVAVALTGYHVRVAQQFRDDVN
jgi:hypothetical protein